MLAVFVGDKEHVSTLGYSHLRCGKKGGGGEKYMKFAVGRWGCKRILVVILCVVVYPLLVSRNSGYMSQHTVVSSCCFR